MMRGIALLYFFLVVTPVNAQPRDLPHYFKDYHYTALTPPIAFDSNDTRTIGWWRPGFIFVMDGGNMTSVGCPSVLKDPPVTPYWLADSKQTHKRKGSLSLVVGLLKAIGVINEKASAELGFNWDKNSEIEFSGLKQPQFATALTKKDLTALADGKTAETDALTIPTDCSKRIRDLLKEGSKVYLVESSIEASSFSVKVDNTSGFKASADFAIKDLITLKPGIEATSIDKTSAEFNRDGHAIRLAIRAIPIKKLRRDNSVSTTPVNMERMLFVLGRPEVLSGVIADASK